MFSEANQHDITVDQEKLRAELDERRELGLPPGLTDDDNEENPAGDLLVWKTLLDLAKTRNRNVLFVCNERKPDWWTMDQARELYLPAFELVNEFWRETEGKAFSMVDFPTFLEMYGAEAEAVSDAERQLDLASQYPMASITGLTSFESAEMFGKNTRVAMATYNRLDEYTSHIIQREFRERYKPYLAHTFDYQDFTFIVAFRKEGAASKHFPPLQRFTE